MFIKNVHQKPNPFVMAAYLKEHFPDAHSKAAYEAGKLVSDTTTAYTVVFGMPGG